jgi:hypothetical protein
MMAGETAPWRGGNEISATSPPLFGASRQQRKELQEGRAKATLGMRAVINFS